MKVLSFDDFLQIFSKPTPGWADFQRVAKVRVGDHLHPLREYIKQKNIDIADIKTLWTNLRSRNEYLTRFYEMSLRIHPERIHFENPMKNKSMNNNQDPTLKNLIRNLHFWDILKNTQSGIENNVTYLDMLTDLYDRSILDYKLLAPSSLFYIREGRMGSVFSSYYFRASILNPYLVYSLNMSVLKGTRIFTPTLGWSSYCYGFLECPDVTEYVGTDVIPQVCEKTRDLAKAISPQVLTTIFCKPSENLGTPSFLAKYRNHFDTVFFSPPYYRMELYEGENQSTNKYTTYEEWLSKYWEPTIQLCHKVLEKGGKLCYILSGYGSKEHYDLITDMNAVTRKYFRLKSRQPMYNKNVHVTKHRETAEEIIIFVKDN